MLMLMAWGTLSQCYYQEINITANIRLELVAAVNLLLMKQLTARILHFCMVLASAFGFQKLYSIKMNTTLYQSHILVSNNTRHASPFSVDSSSFSLCFFMPGHTCNTCSYENVDVHWLSRDQSALTTLDNPPATFKNFFISK